jgi:hypothetical protein
MFRHSSATWVALAVVAVLGLAGLMRAGEQVPFKGQEQKGHEDPMRAGEQVPFKGSFEGDVTVTPLAPPYVMVDVEATGEATHLGKFTLDIPHVVNRAKGTAVGSYEFTAANGDTLSAKFTGTATPTATLGVLYIEETATITGGTGRFAGATGSFSVERSYDTVAGTTSGSFEGTITVGDDDDDD